MASRSLSDSTAGRRLASAAPSRNAAMVSGDGPQAFPVESSSIDRSPGVEATANRGSAAVAAAPAPSRQISSRREMAMVYWNVRDAVAEWTTAPLVPVIVSVDVPAATFLLDEIVNVEAPELVMDAGVNFAVTNLGNPVTASVTAPVKPGGIVTVYEPLASRARVRLGGEIDMEKSV